MNDRNKTFLLAFLTCLLLLACTAARKYRATITTDKSAYFQPGYDDTTLTPLNTAILLPYNRFVDAAGTVIRFGNKAQENHSLDCVLLPGENVLAVEDRFGVAFISTADNRLLWHVDYGSGNDYKGFISTYGGITVWEEGPTVHLLWGASNTATKKSFVFDAVWDGKKAVIKNAFPFASAGLSDMALPNDLLVRTEGGEPYLYVVLNGNNQLVKMGLKEKKTVWTTRTGMAPFGLAEAAGKLYVTDWGGPVPDAPGPTAGIPYARVYIDPATGAAAVGSVTVIDPQSGKKSGEIKVGLHPCAILSGPDERLVFVANANSDAVSVISTATDKVIDSIPVQLNPARSSFIGDSPNALALSKNGDTLYVANGLDNAIAVVKPGAAVGSPGKGHGSVEGFIPTEAYPAGLALSSSNQLYIANLEGEGARAKKEDGTYNSHRQEATVSVIPVPDKATLRQYTARAERANLVFRAKLSMQLPRRNVAARPVPERIGEPSLFKHAVYVIKENRTYDQVLGDVPEGNGRKDVCIYGDTVTPNQHRMAKDFLLMDNYYASGKSSAEGHQWTDAAMVTDYVERNVQAWFNSYPHVQTDAMVYSKKGFIWNNALDHGKSVRIYGEAATPKWKGGLGWKEIYSLYREGKPFVFENVTTITRVEPVLSPLYPGYDNHSINDQLRADAFIKELHDYEKMPGDAWPNLLIVALPADHTAGTREGFPRPEAMVADNDLALGRMLEALTRSRFWDSTAVFVTEDDSQAGWDHVSAYRTTGFVMSPYSRLGRTVHTNYNQTCVVRTIEQILGLPPMNAIDATALPMFDCFTGAFNKTPYTHLKNRVPLDLMNKGTALLKGRERDYALLSATPQFDRIDGGNDDLLNRILWFAAKGPQPYPKHMTVPAKHRKDDDDDD